MLQTTGCARGVSLRNVLPAGRFFRSDDITASRVSIQAKHCRPGDIYVALTLASGDGHDEAELAIEKGAVGIVTERLLPLNVPQILVKDSREALGRICHELADRPTE